MTEHRNSFGLPIGFPLPHWQPRPSPPRTAMTGRFCRLEPLDPERHAAALHEANREGDGRNFTYLAAGPFASLTDYRAWMDKTCCSADPMFHTIIDLTSGRPAGVAAYLRIEPAVGVIEVGHINYAPPLQKQPGATEAMYLMMRRVFDEVGYRRYEWKCDSLNAPSRAAAERLGFRFEGVFRQATVYRERNRDTAWFSILDSEWPALRRAFERWLDPGNFAAAGRQKRRLHELR